MVDLDSGEAKLLPFGEDVARSGDTGVNSLAFDGEGALYSGQRGGIRRWDVGTGESVAVLGRPEQTAFVTADATGRRLAVLLGKETSGRTPEDPEVFVLDLPSGARWPVRSHGPEVAYAALDPSGDWLVTADTTGLVRIGSAQGGEPHLLPGGPTPKLSPAVSPDGRWIVAGSGSDILLWPMPDVTQPPLHTLPHEVLMAKLDALTNLRVVRDPSSPTGWGEELGPFPGWRDVPSW